MKPCLGTGLFYMITCLGKIIITKNIILPGHTSISTPKHINLNSDEFIQILCRPAPCFNAAK